MTDIEATVARKMKMEELLGAKEELGFWRGVIHASGGDCSLAACLQRDTAFEKRDELRSTIEALRKELSL